MPRTLRGAVLGAVATVVLASCQPVQPWSSELAGVDSTGADSPDLGTSEGVISPDGTKVAFVTRSDDLGPTDTNGGDDVYVRDLVTGQTTLISVNEAGTDSGNGLSHMPRFSADGTTLAFVSRAKDLTTDDLEPEDPLFDAEHAFLYDLTTGDTTWVSTFTPFADSYHTIRQLLLSPDGTEVLYTYSESTGIYVYTRATGIVREVTGWRISVPDWVPSLISFSPDSSKVVFQTFGPGLDPRDMNGESDVYVADLLTNTTTLVSVNHAGTAAGDWGGAHEPSFAPDSTKVVFWSHTTDLVPTDPNGRVSDVFVRDLATNTTSLVSVDANGSGTNGDSTNASFTDGGDGIVFSSLADDLGPTDSNGVQDAYHRDLARGATTLVSVNAEGTDSGNGVSRAVGGDLAAGRVGFYSEADDLGPRDTNGGQDLYAHDVVTGATTLVSADAAGTDSGNGPVVAPDVLGARLSVSADGRRIAVPTDANDLGATDTNGLADVYVATLRASDVGVTADASPEPVASGSTLTYQVDVTNAGPDPADDLGVLVALPEGTEFAAVTTTAGSCEPPAPESPRTVACAFGTGAVGDIATVTVDVEVTAPAGASLAAVIVVGTTSIDDHGGDNVATVETSVA